MQCHIDDAKDQGHQPSWSTVARVVRLLQVLLLLTWVPPSRAGDLPVIIDVDPCPQCRVVNSGGLSEITVTFNTDVNLEHADVRVRTRASMGANVGFTLSGTPRSDTVTIVLDEAVEADMVTIVIDYTITSVGTDEALDGEVSDPRSLALPSGDGLPGGQAVLQFAVLQGDVNGDFAVNSFDQSLVINHLFESIDPCTCDDMAPIDLPDVDGNGVVDFDDLNLVSAALGLSIPATDGAAPTVMLSPAAGETVCGELDTVTADFNESLAPDTATATTLFALDPNGDLQASSSATLGGSDDMIDYTFDPPLSSNVDYDFTLSESIMDPSGELIERTLFGVSTSRPIIDLDPVGQTVCELETATFVVQASGTDMLTYQWRLDGVDLVGETDSTLIIDSAEMTDQGYYSVVVADDATCSVISNSALLVVEDCGSIGACCFPEDLCLEAIDATDCKLIDGRFLGNGSTCDEDEDGDGVIGCDDLCLGTPPGTPVDEDGCSTIGACCFLDVGVCLDGLDEDTCVNIDGDYLGHGSFCNPDTCPPLPRRCEGDVNGDGIVDPLDSGFILARFGCPVGTGIPNCDLSDQNGDGVVNPLDVGFVLARFGDCP